MAYSSWSVVQDEQPSEAKWNILGTNDKSFVDGDGYSITNNQWVQAKDSAGDTKNLIKLGSDNNLHFGQWQYDSEGTPSTVSDIFIQTGWEFFVGNGTDSATVKTITFPTAYTNLYGIWATYNGRKDGSDPADVADNDGVGAQHFHAYVYNQTATSFYLAVSHDLQSTHTSSLRSIVSWMAIGN